MLVTTVHLQFTLWFSLHKDMKTFLIHSYKGMYIREKSKKKKAEFKKASLMSPNITNPLI